MLYCSSYLSCNIPRNSRGYLCWRIKPSDSFVSIVFYFPFLKFCTGPRGILASVEVLFPPLTALSPTLLSTSGVEFRSHLGFTTVIFSRPSSFKYLTVFKVGKTPNTARTAFFLVVTFFLYCALLFHTTRGSH